MTVPVQNLPPRTQQIALAASMFFINGVFGFLQPFVPLYLTGAGLSRLEFGYVTALGTGLALLIQPVLGRLSDRFDARRPLMIAAAIFAGGAYLAYRQAHGLWLFTFLTALGVNGYQYLNAVGGVLVGRMAQTQGGGAAYVRYRVWGSVGYIVIAMGTGLLVNRYLPAHSQTPLTREQLDPVFTYGPLLFFVIAFLSLFVPDARPVASSQPTASDAPSPQGASWLSGRLLSSFDWFLIAYFLYQFSLYGASSFLSLYMKSLGAKPLQITEMFAAGVISEVLVMSRIGRWTDRFGRRPALIGAFLLMPIRLLLYAPATGPLWVLFVQTMHGFNFGIIGTIAVVFVNDHARDGNRGTLQARLAATAGIGLALGPLVCGWLTDRWGIPAMFVTMSLVGFAAAFLMITRVRESHPSPEPLPGIWRRLA